MKVGEDLNLDKMPQRRENSSFLETFFADLRKRESETSRKMVTNTVQRQILRRCDGVTAWPGVGIFLVVRDVDFFFSKSL